jgi:hypothetical protein
MFKRTKLAQCIGTALALSYAAAASATLPNPGALGDAFMHFTDFQINAASGGPGSSGIPGAAAPGFGGASGTETATATASLNGVNAPAGNSNVPIGTAFVATTTIGTGFGPSAATTTPLIANNPVLGYGSGAYSSSSGASLVLGSEVYLHSLSQLNNTGVTNASSTQDVNATFTINVGATTSFELLFGMERFVRAGLGPQGHFSAAARTSFVLTVTDINGNEVMVYSPNGNTATDLSGTCVAAGDCVSFSDPFSLQSGLTINNQPVDIRGIGNTGALQTGDFEIELTLAGGLYNFQIQSNATTSARILQIPEPGSLALLGLGLLGLGAVVRKQKIAA